MEIVEKARYTGPMARRESSNMAGIALGAGLVLLGLVAVVWPSVGGVPHFGIAGRGVATRGTMEPATKTTSRIAGAAAILLGAALLKLSQRPD